jgi:hypothetical protein
MGLGRHHGRLAARGHDSGRSGGGANGSPDPGASSTARDSPNGGPNRRTSTDFGGILTGRSLAMLYERLGVDLDVLPVGSGQLRQLDRQVCKPFDAACALRLHYFPFHMRATLSDYPAIHNQRLVERSPKPIAHHIALAR